MSNTSGIQDRPQPVDGADTAPRGEPLLRLTDLRKHFPTRRPGIITPARRPGEGGRRHLPGGAPR